MVGCFAGQLEEIEGVIRYCVSGIEFSFRILTGLAAFGKTDEVVGIKETLRADECAVEFFEAVSSRVGSSEVPLACDEGAISSRLQHLGNRLGFRRNDASVAGATEVIGGHVTQANSVWVLSGEDCGSGRAATASVIKLGQTNTTFGERIEHWGFNFTPKATEITEAEIVCENVEYVGFVGCIEAGGGRETQESQKSQREFHDDSQAWHVSLDTLSEE